VDIGHSFFSLYIDIEVIARVSFSIVLQVARYRQQAVLAAACVDASNELVSLQFASIQLKRSVNSSYNAAGSRRSA
jgi:hypothetical protein